MNGPSTVPGGPSEPGFPCGPVDPEAYIQLPADPAGPGAPFNATDALNILVANEAVNAYVADDADTAMPGIDPDPCG